MFVYYCGHGNALISSIYRLFVDRRLLPPSERILSMLTGVAHLCQLGPALSLAFVYLQDHVSALSVTHITLAELGSACSLVVKLKPLSTSANRFLAVIEMLIIMNQYSQRHCV